MAPARELFDPAFFPDHGGGLGEVLYWASTTLFQRIGAHIIAVLLLLSGLLLVCGRSVSDMISAGHRGFERAKRGTVGFATAIKESRINTDPDLLHTDPVDTDPIFGPPEPLDDEPVIREGEPAGLSRRSRPSPTSTRPCGSPTWTPTAP